MDESETLLRDVLRHQARDAHLLAFQMKNIVHEARSLVGDHLAQEAAERFSVCYPLIHMAGVSAVNLLTMAESEGICARDTYGISRSCVELCVNFAFLLNAPNESITSAREHAIFLHLRRLQRSRKIGGWDISLQYRQAMSDESRDTLDRLTSKFTNGKGRLKNWSNQNIYQKIESIGQQMKGPESTRFFSGAAEILYEISSEYLHGSLFSAYHFMGINENGQFPDDISGLSNRLSDHIQESLLGAFFGLQGALECFADYVRDEEMRMKFRLHFKNLLPIFNAAKGGNWSASIS